MHRPLFICGLGWLGQQIAAKQFHSRQVLGTTRSAPKCEQLNQRGIEAHMFSLGEDIRQLASLIEGADVILNLPGGRKTADLSGYAQQMTELVKHLSAAKPHHLIFISTTSVYGSQWESEVTEQSTIQPDTESGKANAAIENEIRQQAQTSHTILRLAGLIGENRHPVNFLAGKHLTNGNQRVNLVHGEDVVSAVNAIVEHGPFNETLHLCSTDHPKRGEYYPYCATQRQLVLPEFSDTQLPAEGKVINASYTIKRLGISLRYPSPYDMC